MESDHTPGVGTNQLAARVLWRGAAIPDSVAAMPRDRLHALFALVFGLLVAGCNGTTAASATSTRIPANGMAVATKAGVVPADLCPASRAVDPLVGILEGDPADSVAPVWLRGTSGQRLEVVWPAGFWVRFDPAAQLVDERGKVVLRAGDYLRLLQVNTFDHHGTTDDPYIARGWWEGGSCYR
jgi:hypothetical protein